MNWRAVTYKNAAGHVHTAPVPARSVLNPITGEDRSTLFLERIARYSSQLGQDLPVKVIGHRPISRPETASEITWLMAMGANVVTFAVLIAQHDITYAAVFDAETWKRSEESISRIRLLAASMPALFERFVPIWNQTVDAQICEPYRGDYYGAAYHVNYINVLREVAQWA